MPIFSGRFAKSGASSPRKLTLAYVDTFMLLAVAATVKKAGGEVVAVVMMVVPGGLKVKEAVLQTEVLEYF